MRDRGGGDCSAMLAFKGAAVKEEVCAADERSVEVGKVWLLLPLSKHFFSFH